MNIEDLQALVEKRRSTRGYDEDRAVSDDRVRTILECARWAPSGGNGQPWEFVVVREQSVRYKIADYYMKQMEQKREMDLAVRGTAKMTGEAFATPRCISSCLAIRASKKLTRFAPSSKKPSPILSPAWPMRRC